MTLLNRIFGNRNERLIKRLAKTVAAVNALEPALSSLPDAALAAKTTEFRERLARGTTLDDLLPEAFAVVREAGKRVLRMRHFDVQLIGGIVLHQGKIAEMRTGEGKTLVATLAAYLNALPGQGVHVVTVNDYLARRDARWMGGIYEFLGLTVGVVVPGLSTEEKRAAYAADISYGTNNEFGFDYLRDNMAFSSHQRMQRGLNFAVIDEVDSILIDEARTPLVISGPTENTSELYQKINLLVPKLTRQEAEDAAGDYYVDEKAKQALLSEQGHQRVEELLGEAGLLADAESLYDPANIVLMHHLDAALRAHTLYQRNVDYIVRDNQIIIVDEFTGRTLPGRRWSEGLHQAVEAKEGVPIQNENQTLASITLQNYFRLYSKRAGMTGTADTEAFEFQQIYGLEVVVIPTHKPMVRQDHGDLVYLSAEEKFNAIAGDIRDCRARQQPVLVGTVSIEISEHLSQLLQKENIPHQVLNAKFHEKEAEIVAQAGSPSAVTIATNMAGRGTDIVLGGNLETAIAALENPDSATLTRLRAEWQVTHDRVIESGGLHMIGTERHESRRIDNQLRGRSGRQGDPGSSRFYLSLEDNLMRIFASERVAAMMQKLGMQQGEAIEHPWVTKAIENAQRKVEGRNFDIRKQLLEYDDVANDQRKVIYQQRNEIMDTEDVSETIAAIRQDVIGQTCGATIPKDSLEEQWDVAGLEQVLERDFGLQLPIQQWLKDDASLHEETLHQRIQHEAEQWLKTKEARFGAETMRRIEKAIMLEVLDTHWKEHLAAMDYLRQGIHLRGYAQKNPKQEFKREGFELFARMLERVKREVLRLLCQGEVVTEQQLQAEQQRQAAALQFQHAEASAFDAATPEPAAPAGPAQERAAPFVRGERKVGRNEPCPCGSGKKYKHCHGQLA